MDIKKLAANILKLSPNIEVIEKSLILSFMLRNGCRFEKSDFFQKYLEQVSAELANDIIFLFDKANIELSLEMVIQIFELIIPDNDRKENGVVYTPASIKNYIVRSVITSDFIPTICDPACGCGSFLLTAAEYLHNKYLIPFNEIFANYIFGVDIMKHNIDKCTALFNLLALFVNNEVLSVGFNLTSANSLEMDWLKYHDGFDVIVGNPPYVRSKNISESVKKTMGKWRTAKTGNVDLYIPFYELGLSILNSNGKLGYISPNTFLQSVNGRSLRGYLADMMFSVSILDFRETQVFKNVTSYTAITLINKSITDGVINYALLNGKHSLEDYSFTKYPMNNFERTSPWRLSEKGIDEKIRAIENIGVKLDSYKIRNGLATLKNDVFFFAAASEDNDYYYRNYNGTTYKIEKSICINVVKPNIIKTENELNEKIEKAIFPYNKNNNGYSIISEEIMQAKYPYTYEFFLSVKNVLLSRDKGNGNYSAWYAYGRTQGMDNFGKKLLIPYISDIPIAVISTDSELLFYCGYAVFTEDDEALLILKKILESSVFWFYIKNTSKPYSKGYMSFAKNYIKGFGIPVLNNAQKQVLLSLTEKDDVDSYIKSLYGFAT